MKPLALSTMFAQQERFADGAVFARFAADAGYDAIEISHSTPVEKIERILQSVALPVTSVHQPAPWVRHSNGRGNSYCNLGGLDADERKAAIDYAVKSIELCGRIGANRLIVHLGHVGEVVEQFEDEREMRRMYDSGRAEDERFLELREAVIERRRAEVEPYLENARESLIELVRAAEPHKITIGVENRYHYHEMPHPGEYEQVFNGLYPEQAGYWHDVGHAEVLHRLGLVDRRAWLDGWSSRLVGAHLHDVIGLGDHRAPGDGDVDWDYIVAGVGHLSEYTLEINQHQSDEKAREAITFLERIGLR
ncbi:MAG: sugar phosphate isomerase/epimerase [Dehalococcoidia bacterium]|nr:sugar phosphate isomerase/epimerase [Dehalococcoidia bacterium]